MNCIWWNHNGLYSWTVPIDWVPLSRLLDLQTAQWLWKWAIVITCPTIYIKDFIATLCKCVVTCNIYIPCVNPSTKHPTTIIRYTHLLMASFRTHSHFIVIALRIFNCVYNFIILIAIFSLLHAQNLYALYITCMHTSFNCFHAFRYFLKWKKKFRGGPGMRLPPPGYPSFIPRLPWYPERGRCTGRGETYYVYIIAKLKLNRKSTFCAHCSTNWRAQNHSGLTHQGPLNFLHYSSRI